MDKKLILIGGGSCAGKTTLSTTMQKVLGVDDTIIIHQDNYFADYSAYDEENLKKENFDRPEAYMLEKLRRDVFDILKCKSVLLPIYDFERRRVERLVECNSDCKYIVLEGLLALYDKLLNELANLKIFMDIDLDFMLARRILRDTKERNFSFESIIDRYLNMVKPSFNEYVLPCRKDADCVLSGNISYSKNDIIKLLHDYNIIVG